MDTQQVIAHRLSPTRNSTVEPIFVFACFFLLYVATSSGDLTGDSEIRWLVAQRLVDTGGLDIPPDSTPLIAHGTNGKTYSLYGPGQPVCLIPFVCLGRWLSRIPFLAGQDASEIGQFLASLVFFPLIGALSVVLVYRIAREITGDLLVARWSAVILGAGTMHWHYTVNTYEDSQVTLLLLVALWAVQRRWNHRWAWRHKWLACAAMGLALCFRPASVVVSLPLGLVALARDFFSVSGADTRRRVLLRWGTAIVFGTLPFALWIAWLNWSHFGSPFDPGGGAKHATFKAPFFSAALGLLISPGKGVFWFNPVLLCSLVGVWGLWRAHRSLAITILATCAGAWILNARYTFWGGDLAWGPRYLTPTLGFAVLAILPVLWRAHLPRAFRVLFGISLAVQVASVVYNFGLEFFQDGRHGKLIDAYVWKPTESHLLYRFRNIALHAAGRPILESIPPAEVHPELYQIITTPEEVARMHAVDWFPFKAEAYLGEGPLPRFLLAIWLVNLAALAATILWWRRWLRTAPGTDRVLPRVQLSPTLEAGKMPAG